jgi:alginate O-acetyltransferase complex protein AlgI
MVFSSLTFLLVFLPALMLCYFIVPKKYVAARRYVLMVFSVIFYAAGEPLYFFAIAACVGLTYLLSWGIEKKKKLHFWLSLAINIIPLIIFKYLNFIITNLNLLPFLNIPPVELVMPIGISFYTFQMLTYIIDLYRGDVKRQKNVGYLALYIFLFPQLIAGPIVRYQDVELDIGRCQENWDAVKQGSARFIKGMVKKVIFANQTGMIFDTIFALSGEHPEQISVPMMWLAAISYTMQIYFDFSGYSDMAIGLGKIFGFNFLENFNLPYSSLSVSEFWRRWHISMNTFFRDYIYIPLGGSRCSTWRWLFNILVVWSFTGLWHGAHWNFIFWGLYYAVLLVLEKFFLGKILKKLPKFVGWIYTFFCTVVGWSFFLNDSDSFSEMFRFTGRLFGIGEVANPATVRSLELQSCLPYLVIAIILALPTRKLFTKAGELLKKVPGKAAEITRNVTFDAIQLAAIAICLVFIIGGSYNPFIYFRF